MRLNSQTFAGSFGEEAVFVGVDKPQAYLARIATWCHCHHLETTFSKQKQRKGK